MRTVKKIHRNDSVETIIGVIQKAPKTFKVYADVGGVVVWWSNHRTETAAVKSADRLHAEMRELYGE